MGCCGRKEYPDEKILKTNYTYEGTAISIDNEINISQKTKIIINEKPGLTFVTHILSYIYAGCCEWQMQLKCHFSIETVILYKLLFADDKEIFAKSEDELRICTTAW
jgi:hypothetical protein